MAISLKGAAALPVTFRCMRENNKVDARISKFVLPIGATVNMDGTALFVTVASIFIAQMNDIPLNAGSLVTVVLTSTATSIAAASVPSAALVLMLIVLTAIEAPTRDVSLLWAVDWFVDRCRTTNNLLGDCYAAAVVEALSKDDLAKMDEEREKEEMMEAEDEESNQDLEAAKSVQQAKWSQIAKDDSDAASGSESGCNGSLNGSATGSGNGSSVEVPEIIEVADQSNSNMKVSPSNATVVTTLDEASVEKKTIN